MKIDEIKAFIQLDNYETIKNLSEYGKTPKSIPLASLVHGYKNANGFSFNIKIDMKTFIYIFSTTNTFEVEVLKPIDTMCGMILLLNNAEKDVVNLKSILSFLIEFNKGYTYFFDNKITKLQIRDIVQDKETKLPLILVKPENSKELMAVNPLIIFFLTSAWQMI